MQTVDAGMGYVDHIAFLAQAPAQILGELEFVFNDQNSHGGRFCGLAGKANITCLSSWCWFSVPSHELEFVTHLPQKGQVFLEICRAQRRFATLPLHATYRAGLFAAAPARPVDVGGCCQHLPARVQHPRQSFWPSRAPARSPA